LLAITAETIPITGMICSNDVIGGLAVTDTVGVIVTVTMMTRPMSYLSPLLLLCRFDWAD